MEQREQTQGEVRVRERLIETLLKLGLVRPVGMTREAFVEMCDDLCKRLAYMDDLSLDALAESAANIAGGPNSDRFPIAKKILDLAADIQPPKEDDSPLLRKFFRHRDGRAALQREFAPEIRKWMLKYRRWPSAYVLQQAEAAAVESKRDHRRIDQRLACGEEVSAQDIAWRDARLSVVRRCEALAAEGQPA